MTTKEAIDYINAHTWSQWKLGLSRTRELLARLGDPQKKLRFVHVAGSNGKGSTCAMVERILREAGYVTGLYPSPYIEDFRERIQVCGEYITEEALCRITERVRENADVMEDHPTQFELITAIGMVYFEEKKCDLVVLEVGLGGTFDSTNVIDAPEAAVITNIGLEHTEYLGSTLAEIAGNKCGIIKTGADVVCYENAPEVMEVVRRTCEEKGCPLHIARFERLELLEQSLGGQTFLWKVCHRDSPSDTFGRLCADGGGEQAEPLRLRLSLAGTYQLHNAVTALTVVEALRGRGFDIPAGAVRDGLAKVAWPARFEILSRDPLFILDGGHNPQCAEALAEAIRSTLSGRGTGLQAGGIQAPASGEQTIRQEDSTESGDPKVIFLMGMLADKDYRRVIDILEPFSAGFICLTPDSPRALPAEALAQELRDRGHAAQAYETADEGTEAALKAAGEESLPVIAFGSLYMAGALRSAFPEVLKKYQRERKKRQRMQAIERRRSLSEEERREKSAAICRVLSELPEVRGAKTVFSYASTWDEADLDELNRLLERQGKTVCYPVCKKGGAMTAVVPSGKDPRMWQTDTFGIRTPPESGSVQMDPSGIDVIFVPCVVFDRQGGRCGHGAGYYDRFLSALPEGTLKILAAFETQRTEAVVMEETDVRMDMAVTEDGILRF